MAVIIGVLCVLILLVIVLFIAGRRMQIQQLEQENHLMQNYMSSMQEFYETVQERIEAVRRYRHDLAKHIQTLEALIERQEGSEDIQGYMDNLKGRYQTLKKEEYCTDEIVNSVLSIKVQMCREKDIPLELHVEDITYSGVKEVDMVALLQNLLDNAMEANERIPSGEKKGIILEMGQIEDKIRIRVLNHVRPGEEVVFKTWKEKKEEHGIGTKIIDSLVDKYHGTKEIAQDMEKNIFEREIFLVRE
ncbi:MAG: GHKL domain-containing protein [Clostridia bacterium]|nr:GHKL domain-containing protein [Clostridia bacterium]NCC42537.1 GHKL domain-containing protein [Clostridia bacterium]